MDCVLCSCVVFILCYFCNWPLCCSAGTLININQIIIIIVIIVVVVTAFINLVSVLVP